MRARVIRGLKWSVILVVGFVAVVATSLPVQQYLFYRRAKRLLADMQAIELHKSTWADAQVLMRRWGRYGNYSGSCTAESCRYSIDASDAFGTAAAWMYSHFTEKQIEHVPLERVVRIVNAMGSRYGTLIGKFIVQDGLIVRSGVYAKVYVPRPRVEGDDSSYSLLASAYSVGQVQQYADRDGWRSFSAAARPFYSASRPSGCEGCMAAWLTYGWNAPTATVKSLSNIKVDCFRFSANCTTVEDLLPATAPFHFYDGRAGARAEDPEFVKMQTMPLGACDIPVWARARDANRIVAATGLLVGSLKFEGTPEEQDKVKVVDLIKGQSPAGGTIALVEPWEPEERTSGSPEHIGAGEHVILMDFSASPKSPSEPEWSSMNLERCSVVADTPRVRGEIAKGLATNDHLRGPELGPSIWAF